MQAAAGKDFPYTSAATNSMYVEELKKKPKKPKSMTHRTGKKPNAASILLLFHPHQQHRPHFEREEFQTRSVTPKCIFIYTLNTLCIQDRVLACRQAHILACTNDYVSIRFITRWPPLHVPNLINSINMNSELLNYKANR